MSVAAGAPTAMMNLNQHAHASHHGNGNGNGNDQKRKGSGASSSMSTARRVQSSDVPFHIPPSSSSSSSSSLPSSWDVHLLDSLLLHNRHHTNSHHHSNSQSNNNGDHTIHHQQPRRAVIPIATAGGHWEKLECGTVLPVASISSSISHALTMPRVVPLSSTMTPTPRAPPIVPRIPIPPSSSSSRRPPRGTSGNVSRTRMVTARTDSWRRTPPTNIVPVPPVAHHGNSDGNAGSNTSIHFRVQSPLQSSQTVPSSPSSRSITPRRRSSSSSPSKRSSYRSSLSKSLVMATTRDISDQPILVPMDMIPSPKSSIVTSNGGVSPSSSSPRSSSRRSLTYRRRSRSRSANQSPSLPPPPSPSSSLIHGSPSPSSHTVTTIAMATLSASPRIITPLSSGSPMSSMPSISLSDAQVLTIDDMTPSASIADAVASNRTISSSLRHQLMAVHHHLESHSLPLSSSSMSTSIAPSSTTTLPLTLPSANNSLIHVMHEPKSNDDGDEGDVEEDDDTPTPLASVSLPSSARHQPSSSSVSSSSQPLIAHQHAATSPNDDHDGHTHAHAHANVHNHNHNHTTRGRNGRRRSNKVELDRAERTQWLSLRGKAPRHNLSVAERQRCKEMFTMLDLDQSNSVDVDELRRAMLSFGMKVPREDLMQTIAMYDSDRNGELTFDEFIQGYWSGGNSWDQVWKVEAKRKRAKMLQRGQDQLYQRRRRRIDHKPQAATPTVISKTTATGIGTTSGNKPGANASTTSGDQTHNGGNSNSNGDGGGNDMMEFKSIDAIAPLSRDEVDDMFNQIDIEHQREERVRRYRDEDDKNRRKQRVLHQLALAASAANAANTQDTNDSADHHGNGNDNDATHDASTSTSNSNGSNSNAMDHDNDITREIAAQIAEEKRFEEEEKRLIAKRMADNRRQKCHLPFFLWVPAYHRMHTLGILMDPQHRHKHRLPPSSLSSSLSMGMDGTPLSSRQESYWGEAHSALFEQQLEEARSHGLWHHASDHHHYHARSSDNGISYQRISVATPGLHRRRQLAGVVAALQQKLVNRHITETAALSQFPARAAIYRVAHAHHTSIPIVDPSTAPPALLRAPSQSHASNTRAARQAADAIARHSLPELWKQTKHIVAEAAFATGALQPSSPHFQPSPVSSTLIHNAHGHGRLTAAPTNRAATVAITPRH